MNTVYHYAGFVVVWATLIIAVAYVLFNVCDIAKTALRALDFLNWYKFYAIKQDPNWKPTTGFLKMYWSAMRHVYNYDENSKITHNCGVVYIPYNWK